MREDRREDGESQSREADPSARLEELLAEHREAEAPEEPVDPGPESRDDPLISPLGGSSGTAGSDTEPGAAADADLPDAPLFALLRTVEDEIGVDRIDRMWVFPPRRLQVGETSVVVVAAYPELDRDRRRVYAAHYTVPAEAREARLALAEYGTAPTERVGRLVEEVVERIKDGPAGAPVSHRVEGGEPRWREVLHGLAERYLEEVSRDPRLGH